MKTSASILLFLAISSAIAGILGAILTLNARGGSITTAIGLGIAGVGVGAILWGLADGLDMLAVIAANSTRTANALERRLQAPAPSQAIKGERPTS